MEICDKVDVLSWEVEVLEGLQDLVSLVLDLYLKVLSLTEGLLVDEVKARHDNHWFVCWGIVYVLEYDIVLCTHDNNHNSQYYCVCILHGAWWGVGE